jgi:hypothetical protein
LPPRIENGFGTLEYARIAHEAEKCKHAGPR